MRRALKKGSLQIELKGIFYFSFGRKKLKSVASFFYDAWEKAIQRGERMGRIRRMETDFFIKIPEF